MEKSFAMLQNTDHNEPVTKKDYPAFFHLIRSALLLALREQGILNGLQYRLAAEALAREGADGP